MDLEVAQEGRGRGGGRREAGAPLTETMESCPGQRPGLQVPPAGSSRGLSHTQLTGHLGENCFITAAGAQHTLEEEAGKRRPQIEKDL